MARMSKGLRVFFIAVVVLVIIAGGSVAVLIKYANRVIKSEVESRLGKRFAIERIDLKWGHVEVVGMSFKNEAGREVIKVGDLSVTADFMGLLRKEYIISSLTVKEPYLFVEVDRRGNIVNPSLPPDLMPKQGAKNAKPEKPAPPLVIRKIEIINGSVDYLDRKTPVTPVLTKMRDLDVVMKDVSVPPADTFSDFVLSASVPGNHSTGTVKSIGKIKIKTKDMDLKTNVRSLDITGFKPYFQKESPVDITNGSLDLNIQAKIASDRIHAPGTVVLKDLRFQNGPGMSGSFLGVPLSLVVALLKKSNDEISVNFVLEGDLNNPKFDIKENLMNRISVALAEKLGLPIKGITEAVTSIGAKGAKEVGSTVKGIGETLKKLFK
jgi:hypothetical protein